MDENWIPVRAPLRSVVPIALETTTSLYLFSTELYAYQKGVRGGSITSFGGRIFDLSACKAPWCVSRVEEWFARELTNLFQAHPLTAARVVKFAPPNQIRLQRLFDESFVLKGLAGPYFELATYTITFWSGPFRDNNGSSLPRFRR